MEHMSYTSLEHYIDGNWVKPTGSKTQEVMNPAKNTPIGELGLCLQGRPRTRRWPPPTRVSRTWKKVSALRARQDPAQGRRPWCAPPRRRHRQGAHPGAGQGLDGGHARGAERRRHHRLVRRRRPARAYGRIHSGPWPMGVRQHGDHGADSARSPVSRPGTSPSRRARAQDRRVAGGRLLDHQSKCPEETPRLADRPRQVLP